MTNKKSSRIMFGVTIVVACGSLLLLVFLLQDLEWDVFGQVNLLYLGVILLLSALGTVLYTLEVHLLLRARGFRPSILQTYLVLTASMSANYVTPVKVGIPLRLYLYRHLIQIPFGIGTGLVALETLIGMVIPALLAVLGIVTLFPSVGLLIPAVLLVVLVGGVLIILLIRPSRIEGVLQKLLPIRFAERIARFMADVQSGLLRVPVWALFGMILLLILSFFVTSVRLYFILRMLGYEVNLVHVFFARTISVTAGSASMIPMGLGVRDASITLLLAELGIPSVVALSAAVVERLFSPGWPLLLGLISANILGVSELVQQNFSAQKDADE